MTLEDHVNMIEFTYTHMHFLFDCLFSEIPYVLMELKLLSILFLNKLILKFHFKIHLRSLGMKIYFPKAMLPISFSMHFSIDRVKK